MKKSPMFKLKCLDTQLSKKWFWVIVYPTHKELRSVLKTLPEFNPEDGADVLGIVHPFEKTTIREGKPDVISDNIGIIRLSLEHLNTHIVSHEVVHAALWLYRLEYGTENEYLGTVENADFGQQNSSDEEQFAHIYGQMFSFMTRKLFEKGFWK